MSEETEFVLLDAEPTAVDVAGSEVALLKRAGRRGMRRRVLVDVSARRPRRRLPILVVVALLALGAAVFVVRKRRAAAAPTRDFATAPEPTAYRSDLEPIDNVGTFTG